MPEVYLRYLLLLMYSSVLNCTGDLLTLLSRPVGTSESRCDSFCESWSVSKGASLRTVICSLLLFSETYRQVFFRRRSIAAKSDV